MNPVRWRKEGRDHAGEALEVDAALRIGKPPLRVALAQLRKHERIGVPRDPAVFHRVLPEERHQVGGA